MLLLSIHLILIIVTSARILYRDTISSTTRLAWLLIIFSLPFLGIITYFLFGEVDLGRLTNHRANKLKEELTLLLPKLFHLNAQQKTDIPQQYQSAFHYASSINGFPLTLNNRVELLADASSARSRLIDDIDRAEESINLMYYIWLNDHTGCNVANALIRAAKRGVKCRAMADGLGSRAMVKSNLWLEMKQAGIEVSIALSFKKIIHTIIFSRLDLRNHRKITVIDGYITHCGSQNCADPEFLMKKDFAPWVDIMLRIEGAVATQNQLLFASDWLLEKQGSFEQFDVSHTAHKPGNVKAQILGDGPTERLSATPQLFTTLIHQAQTELIISTPYFVPDASVLEALCSAAYRGVKVSMIFPKRNDSWVVAATSRSYYNKMLTAGIYIYEFSGGLLHSKSLTIDGVVTLIGSSNMDIRSFDLNYENDVLIYDQQVTSDIKLRQQSYIASSSSVDIKQVQAWPKHQRVWHNIIATIGPIL